MLHFLVPGWFAASRFSLLLFLLTTVLLSACGQVEPILEDDARLLSEPQKLQLRQLQQEVFRDYEILFDIHLIRSPVPMNAPSNHEAYSKLQFFVNPSTKQVRLFVDYAVSLRVPNSFRKHIEETQLLPFFDSNDVASGIVITAALIQSQIANRRETVDWQNARSSFEEVTALKNMETTADMSMLSRETPEQALESMSFVLDFVPKSFPAMCTVETQDYLLEAPLSAEDMKRMRSTLDGVPEVLVSGDRAVARYPLVDFKRAPFFLKRGTDGSWLFDLYTRLQSLEMTENGWKFIAIPTDYVFGFQGFDLDENGYLIPLSALPAQVVEDPEPEEPEEEVIFEEDLLYQ